MKLWIGTALTPHGNEYGLVAVVADTREEAIAKANAKLDLDDPGNYVPDKRYVQALLDNLGAMREVTDDVFIDWEVAPRPPDPCSAEPGHLLAGLPHFTRYQSDGQPSSSPH